MAKFNKGTFGGIFYKAQPIGVRRFFYLYKVIPYFLGYDIQMKLLIKRTELNTWWYEGILQVEYLGKTENNAFAIGEPDDKGKWSRGLRIGRPRQPCTLSCSLQLQEVKETDDSQLKVMRATGASLVEDIRVISLHTAFAWGITFFLLIVGSIIGILNLINS